MPPARFAIRCTNAEQVLVRSSTFVWKNQFAAGVLLLPLGNRSNQV
jgi:hypothetical protein